jgi:ADP-ribosyl-[dinitrogen reductase] hydrolase
MKFIQTQPLIETSLATVGSSVKGNLPSAPDTAVQRQIELEDRYLGALLGLACGDAVGTTVEFSARGSFAPVLDMVGGGPFDLKPGQWTDDTSMALCLAESFLAKGAFDARDQMGRYLNWWRWGYLSSTGACFDIGGTVRAALSQFERTGEPLCGDPDPQTAGNGSLMRLAPVVLYGYRAPETILQLAADSSRTTHGAAEAIECCQLFACIIHAALAGQPKNDLLHEHGFRWHQSAVARLAEGHFIDKPVTLIKGSGYCVESLEAALWCFFNTIDPTKIIANYLSFEQS